MIDIHRYYELKHFCLQYLYWAAKIDQDTDDRINPNDPMVDKTIDIRSKSAEKAAETREFYRKRMEMVRNTAFELDPENGKYIFKAVIRGLNYDYLKRHSDMSIDEDTFKDLYLRFFTRLDAVRK